MRFPFLVAAVAFLLFAFWTDPVDARGGKGGGGGGGGHTRSGGPQTHGSGHGGGMKQTTHQPAKDKVTRTAPTKDKVVKDKTGSSAKDLAGQDKTAKSQKTKTQKTRSADDSSAGDSGVDDSGTTDETANKKERQLANFQRQRDKKIAQADHLRQIAERNGNTNLAANADRMEAQALEQYSQKVSHLEKFGVTDPELDAGGGGVTDPVDPGTDTGGDPLADPLGTLQGLLPFGR